MKSNNWVFKCFVIIYLGSNKVIYFDGFDIADGLTIYTCEEATTEAGTSDTDAE